ncbi:MAG: beta-lactamase [Mesorhizobium sp.]|uniref:class C beta-lactamase n=1 Tax=Mesorhizobium sp. TaxID=1871066 RepID=UPI000FEA0980|nr:class C beta-lactamase [Mesorhizobium sp.]RWH82180.1 MAG: beta-lactamase [Mesorhizobium sp.]RWH85181.1 MAG: beta-lactamase [Mesorhizobium sp.]RWH89936.1 MAG: beta-lactamase [Mesorhizobium sp.]RWH98314.1 MAG: beta-lactamase [Mesorhizobium sp.]RWI04678.1 MAG: beta-lactamase [Mesorhizobium sp.]
MKLRHLLNVGIALACLMPLPGVAANGNGNIKENVDRVILPLIEEHGIPGVAVAVVTDDGTEVFNYGVASKQTQKPVDDETLFEVGSISKTFTVTLATYAAEKGELNLSDQVSVHVPELEGSPLGEVALLHLGTHTPGGMPQQFPDDVTNDAEMMQYFKDWRPTYQQGAYRTYANPSIGLLGAIAARSMDRPYIDVMHSEIFPRLGLKKTFLTVPPGEEVNYAQGYTRKDQPTRVSPGVLAAEAYGVKTTASDLAHFLRVQMHMVDVPADIQAAVDETRRGYFKAGNTTQGLIWEEYDYPANLDDLLAGNSLKMSMEPNAVTAFKPPLDPRQQVLINKTGSTNGFGGYIAFVPAKRLGIVLLANKNYPIEARVRAAFTIMEALDTAVAAE